MAFVVSCLISMAIREKQWRLEKENIFMPIELFSFLEAAEESKRQNGVPIRLADVLAKVHSP